MGSGLQAYSHQVGRKAHAQFVVARPEMDWVWKPLLPQLLQTAPALEVRDARQLIIRRPSQEPPYAHACVLFIVRVSGSCKPCCATHSPSDSLSSVSDLLEFLKVPCLKDADLAFQCMGNSLIVYALL